MKRFILSVLFFVALLSIWHLLVLAKVWSVVLLPDPISVWEYLKGAAGDGTLLQASLVTMRRLSARPDIPSARVCRTTGAPHCAEYSSSRSI